MLTGEVFPGEDAQVLVEAIKVDYSGEDVNGITNLRVYAKAYKTPSVEAEGATMVYDSTMGQYLLTIPAAYVPASGIFDVVVKGDDINDVLVRLQVNTADTILAALSADTLIDNILAAINDDLIDGTFTRKKVERLVAAALLGTDTRSDDSKTIKSIDGSKTRITYVTTTTTRTTTLNGD